MKIKTITYLFLLLSYKTEDKPPKPKQIVQPIPKPITTPTPPKPPQKSLPPKTSPTPTPSPETKSKYIVPPTDRKTDRQNMIKESKEDTKQKLPQSDKIQSPKIDYQHLPERIKTQNQTLTIDTQYRLTKSGVIKIDENLAKKMLIIEFTGIGRIQIVLVDKNQKTQDKSFTLIRQKQQKFPIGKSTLKNLIGGYIEIIPKRFVISTTLVKFSSEDFLEMKFNEIFKIETNFINDLDIKISPEKDVVDDKNNRIQFILQSSLMDQDLIGDEDLTFEMNLNSDFAGKNKKSDIRPSGLLGHGIIKTIPHGNKFYCYKNDCVYYMSIKMNNVERITLLPTVFPNYSEIKFTHDLSLMEELEVGESVYYNIKIPQRNSDWIFQKIPFSKDVKFFINPNELPKDDSQFKYQGYVEGQEEFIITNKELNKSQKTISLWIKFEAVDKKQATGFKFKVRRLDNFQQHKIKLNEFQSGLIQKQEMVQYYFNFEESGTHSLKIQLESFNGESDLFVQSCYGSRCKVNQQTIRQIKQNKTRAGQIQRYSRQDLQERNGMQMDQILLQFNCGKGKFDNKFITLKSCYFNIAVRNNSMSGEQSWFKLIIKGVDSMKELTLKESVSMSQNLNENQIFKIPLTKQDLKYKFLILKVVNLVGNCQIFFSKTNKNPSKEDKDGKIQFYRKNTTSFHSIFKSEKILLRGVQDAIYLKVESQSYSVFDIYPYLSDTVSKLNFVEQIKQQIVYKRSLEVGVMQRVDKQNIYFYNFEYKVNHHYKNIDNHYYEFSLNSDENDLKICVQQSDTFNIKTLCDFESSSKILDIDLKFLQNHSNLIISIQKSISRFSEEIFPIEFSLTFSVFDNLFTKLKKVNLFQPGRIFTQQLKGKQFYEFSLDFSNMQKRGLISLTTQNNNIVASISKKLEDDKSKQDQLAELNTINFAFQINNAQQFKQSSMIDNHLYVYMYNNSDHESRFSLLFTYDDVPVQLNAGQGINFPSDYQMYFQYKIRNKNIFNMNIISDQTKFESFLSFSNTGTAQQSQIQALVSEKHFEYKTNLSKEGEIVVDKNLLQKYHNPMTTILYLPKSFRESSTNQADVIDISSKTVLTVHSEYREIYPFETITSKGMKGEFKYYEIVIDQPQNILISLDINSGESDLYINKGKGILPSKSNFWKKSATYKGDEIELKKSMFENEDEMIDVYTIGVYSRVFSSFSITFAPDFGNIFHLKFQYLKNLKMKKNEYYYLSFHNEYEDFTTYLYSKSEIEVNVLQYDKGKNNFMDLIQKDENYVQNFTFHQGDPPRVEFINSDTTKKSNFIIRLRSKLKTELMFSIYNNSDPLEVFAEKRFYFSLNKYDAQVFEIKLDNDYNQIDFDIKLDFGGMEFMVTDDLDKEDDYNELSGPDQKYDNYFIQRTSKINDIVIFKSIFIKVKCKKLSSFSILIKPKNKFKLLREYETELLYADKETSTFVYYQVNEQDLKSLHSLTFNIKMKKYYNYEPELYYISNQDFTLSEDTPFLPMPLVDRVSQDFEQFTQLIIRPDIAVGFYILKFLKNNDKIPIRIQLSINNNKNLQLNGVSQQLLPFSKPSRHKFSMYIPEAGAFRIILESCSKVKIYSAQFITEKETKDINLNSHYFQESPYIQYDSTTNPESVTRMLMRDDVNRGETEEPGVLQFQVQLNAPRTFSRSQDQSFYQIMTEFKPKKKSLILKDYIKIVEDDEEPDKSKIQFEFLKDSQKLRVGVKSPKFRDQLLQDYPEVKKIKIQYIFYLFKNQEEDFNVLIEKCGRSAFDKTEFIKRKTERVMTVSEMNQEFIVSLDFRQKDLDQLNRKQKLKVFVKLEINLIEKEEDFFNINLDEKFVAVPYAYVIFQNKEYTPRPVIMLVALITVVTFIFMIYICVYDQEKNTKYEKGYQNKNQIGQKRQIEINEMSATEEIKEKEDYHDIQFDQFQ